jgi:hypothetical protein
LVEKGKNLSGYVKTWRKYLESRKTNLVISRRFNISALNTAAMAFYGDSILSPCKMFWAIQGVSDNEARILALWFNSTINIAQILSRRAETEGAFMGLDQYILQEFLVLDPKSLMPQQKEHLLNVFDENAKVKLPSVLEQLKTKNSVRKVIDLAILEVLGIKGDREELLDSTYASITKTIKTLATLVKEGQTDGT